MGYRLLLYSVYEFSQKREKFLGIKSINFFDEFLARKDFNEIFQNPEPFLQKHQEGNPKDINDAREFIKDEKFQDENLTMIPIKVIADQTDDRSILSYVCKSKKLPGKVLMNKINELKVPKNLIGKLNSEGSIELDGKTIYVKDVKEPDSAAVVFIIVECPLAEHARTLFTNPIVEALHEDKINSAEEELKVIVHLTPANIVKTPEYSMYLKSFGPKVQHIFTDKDIKDADDELSKQDKLVLRHFNSTNFYNEYFPNHFPKLEYKTPNSAQSIEEILPEIARKSTSKPQLEYVLAPAKNEGFNQLKSSKDSASKIDEIKKSPATKVEYDKALKLIQNAKENPADELKLFKDRDPELAFLGTGSMMPSLYRNVSAFYMRIPEYDDAGILFDCGEGTWYQLKNHYGEELSEKVLKRLKIIFISHIHADHHLGLLQIMRERSKRADTDKEYAEPVYLVVPPNYYAWFARYQDEIEKFSFRLIFSSHLSSTEVSTGAEEVKEDPAAEDEEQDYYEDPTQVEFLKKYEEVSHKNIESFKDFVANELKMEGFRTIPVVHCPQAYACSIGHRSGFNLLYSGDTRFCERIILEATPTTILVHEATFNHELLEQAKARNHATDKQAIQTGMQTKTWKTVLTHFSQRYAKGTTLSNEQRKDESEEYLKYIDNNVVLASDHMRFRCSELSYFQHVSNFFGTLISDE